MRARSALLAVLGVGLMLGTAAPAFAERGWGRGGHGWHHGYGYGYPGWRGYGYPYAWYGPRPYYYGPPVYYAPPPVYYRPGITFGLTIP